MSKPAAEWMLHPMAPSLNPPRHLVECRVCRDFSAPEPDASDADLWATSHAEATDHQDFRFAAIDYVRASRMRRILPDQADDVG
ncbi:DUF7848 domain-containing protein [Streptomyces cinnamoneus]|uniref:DUF7848 domain-containing protein n=1 Tax=Streptomyces cinnamoneus TaxID=53446 RepID=A0A918WQ73_STRCJ|nr:hypothetical protein [Streptomyces cinnamoneus]GHC67079.1 hypothetical protein GCM10010507_51330 [Streptomyces cinnamoneus]